MPASTRARVLRNGDVVRGDTPLGRVEKFMVKGLHVTANNTISLGLGDGTPAWHAFTPDGTRLSDDSGFGTRKAAIAALENEAETLTVTDFKIETGWPADTRFVSCWVSFKGYRFGVSRYAHETQWVCDYLQRPGSFFPVFSNGAGTRYTSAHVLQAEFAEATDRAATEAGFWPIPDIAPATADSDSARVSA